MDSAAKQEDLRRLLSPFGFAEVRWVDECASTNTVLGSQGRTLPTGDANDQPGSEPPGPAVLVADRQTAGRGRLGRVWESPVGSSLTMSVRVPMPGNGHASARAGLVPLAAGLAARETVLALGVTADRVELKWPNDLMDPVTGRKLAGILCESGTTAGTAPTVVIGIGLNLSMPPEVDGVVAERAQWLSEIGASDVNPVNAAAVLAAAVVSVVAQLDSDFEAVIARIRRECATIGRNVRVEQFAETFDGTAVGVDDRGALIVERADTGTQVSVHAADVVHLRPASP